MVEQNDYGGGHSHVLPFRFHFRLLFSNQALQLELNITKLSRIYCFKIGLTKQIVKIMSITKRKTCKLKCHFCCFAKEICCCRKIQHKQKKCCLPFVAFEFHRHKNDDIFVVSFVFIFLSKMFRLSVSYTNERRKIKANTTQSNGQQFDIRLQLCTNLLIVWCDAYII